MTKKTTNTKRKRRDGHEEGHEDRHNETRREVMLAKMREWDREKMGERDRERDTNSDEGHEEGHNEGTRERDRETSLILLPRVIPSHPGRNFHVERKDDFLSSCQEYLLALSRLPCMVAGKSKGKCCTCLHDFSSVDVRNAFGKNCLNFLCWIRLVENNI